jgi:hypothetical protein
MHDKRAEQPEPRDGQNAQRLGGKPISFEQVNSVRKY